MLRVRVCAAHMGGFLGLNSLNKGPFFGRFSINMGGLSRNWRKMAKNGPSSVEIHHKNGYESKFRQLEEGTFLKTGRQTPIHPQVMYPPRVYQTLTKAVLPLSAKGTERRSEIPFLIKVVLPLKFPKKDQDFIYFTNAVLPSSGNRSTSKTTSFSDKGDSNIFRELPVFENS